MNHIQYLDKEYTKRKEEREMKKQWNGQPPHMEEKLGFSEPEYRMYRDIRNEIVNAIVYSALTPVFGETLLTMYRKARELVVGSAEIQPNVKNALDKDENAIYEQIERLAKRGGDENN